MKDSDQKDDYYTVSKQPPIPMGAPPPPPPMGMPPMGMPMGGPMPPGAPMAPQEEELQEGEYMDPATGKIMRRGEEFKVDPDRELDDTKNIAKWFDTLKKNVSYIQPGTIQATPAMMGMQQQTALEEAEEALAETSDPRMRDRLFNREKFDSDVFDREKAQAKLDAAKRGKQYFRSIGQYDTEEDAQRAVDTQEQYPGYNEFAAKNPDAMGYRTPGKLRRIPGLPKYVAMDNERDFSPRLEVERMPRPDAGETDAFGTPDMPYTQRFDTPSWMKEVKR